MLEKKFSITNDSNLIEPLDELNQIPNNARNKQIVVYERKSLRSSSKKLPSPVREDVELNADLMEEFDNDQVEPILETT